MTAPVAGAIALPTAWGEWVHLWTGKVYGTVGAGQSVTVAAPIGQPAVFYRRGSAVGATLVQNLKAVGIDAR